MILKGYPQKWKNLLPPWSISLKFSAITLVISFLNDYKYYSEKVTKVS